jgi:quercetin dioxygenase-like cupin family protein
MPTLTGFGSLKAVKAERINDKIMRKLVSGKRGMIVWWSVKKGAHAHAHKHKHEQIFWMIKGAMEFRMGRKKRVCKAGDVCVIPGGVEHEAWFHADTEVVDVFAPPRGDFLEGGPPAYMRE